MHRATKCWGGQAGISARIYGHQSKSASSLVIRAAAFPLCTLPNQPFSSCSSRGNKPPELSLPRAAFSKTHILALVSLLARAVLTGASLTTAYTKSDNTTYVRRTATRYRFSKISNFLSMHSPYIHVHYTPL